MKLQAPKGTRDFYPNDMAIRNQIAAKWHEVSRRNGFVEYDGPIFEDLNLYRIKSGDEIVAQLFHFEDRGQRAFALRPEMTPTLARMVAAKAHALAKPIKWYAVPRLCRAERPQRGRLREFFQWNIDIVGEDSAVADAECVFVAADFFRALGLSSAQVRIKLNSRAVVTALLQRAEIPVDRLPPVYAALDKRDKMDADAFAKTLADLGLTEPQRTLLVVMGDAKGEAGFARVEALLEGHEQGRAECARLREVFDHLASMRVADYCVYDMGVVRGLAYYTGCVFEAFAAGGLKRAICGGGRYDELVSNLGGPPMGGVGFATSDVVIQDVLAEFNLLSETRETGQVFVVDADPAVFDGVLEVVARLRAGGVRADFSYKRQAIGKQFKQAASRKAAFVVIVEPDFSARREVSIKDLRTGGQTRMALEAFLESPLQPVSKEA